MHQYIVGTLFEIITINIEERFPESKRRNRYLPIAMDYVPKWQNVYAILNQEIQAVAFVMKSRILYGYAKDRTYASL
jgi:hypothetical protein